MLYIAIFMVFYISLVFTDLVPMIREKKKKYLWFSIPAYAVALVVNIMIGLNFRFTSITAILERFMSGFIK
ncbi:MAG TPA: hypothetical protein VHP31_05360 [Caproicibacter sp.]|nr:hypothetical protein [Caproicibacter sp.]